MIKLDIGKIATTSLLVTAKITKAVGGFAFESGKFLIQRASEEYNEYKKKVAEKKQIISPQDYIVRNNDIRQGFNKALYLSTVKFDIVSTWMNFRVINAEMTNSFEYLLRRGVFLKLQNIYDQRSATMESDLRAEIEADKKQSSENFMASYEFKLREMNKLLDIAESELRNKQREIAQLKIDHATEIEHIKIQLNDESQQIISNLTKDIVCDREDYDKILSSLRHEFETNYSTRIRELETKHLTRKDDLSKILHDNQKEFDEERADLEHQKDREIADLQSAYQSTLPILKDRLNEQDEYIQALKNSQTRQQNEIYTNKELHKLPQQTLRKAKVEVDIMSPWVNRAIFGKLEKQIEKLLIRGVILKIVYDIENNNYSDAQAKNDRVESFVRELQAKFGNYKNFHIDKINYHGKMFICDNEYYVLTIMNPLSNKGDSWEEIGEKSYNKGNLLAYRKNILITANVIDGIKHRQNSLQIFQRKEVIHNVQY